MHAKAALASPKTNRQTNEPPHTKKDQRMNKQTEKERKKFERKKCNENENYVNAAVNALKL